MGKQIKLKCDYCGEEFLRRFGEVNRNKKLDRKHFCNRSCQTSYINKHCNGGNPTKLRPNSRLDEYSQFRNHLKQAKSHSKKKKREVTITLYDLKKQWDKQEGKCPYTGWDLKNANNTIERIDRTSNRASLDRIDSSKGYTPDNIQFVCLIAQYAKNGWGDEDLHKFCQAVVKKLEKR